MNEKITIMSLSSEKVKILQELDLIPDNRLPELYYFLHDFRLGLEVSRESKFSILSYAGCWRDLPNDTFEFFIQEITQRRQQAFARRRHDETGRN
jgi:hypothetical protein